MTGYSISFINMTPLATILAGFAGVILIALIFLLIINGLKLIKIAKSLYGS